MNHRKNVARGLVGFYGGITRKVWVPKVKKTVKRRRRKSSPNGITCRQFARFLISQEPIYDAEVLRDMRPTDGFIGYYLGTDPVEQSTYDYFSRLLPRCIELAEPKPIEFAAADNTERTFDRFRDIFPNVTRQWRDDTLPV